jgi:coenzyme F420 hydrogenase subunit gamma
MIQKPNKEESKPTHSNSNDSDKLKIGYIHLSGCTGDLMSLTENYDDLFDLLNAVDIVYGQTLVDKWEMPEMDLVLIEGSVCLQDEHSLKELKEAREKSKLLVALGSCASSGGFTLYAKGGQQAQPQHESFISLQNLVKVDMAIPGCPPSPEILKKVLLAAVNKDMDYLAPFMDIAKNDQTCGCDLQKKVVNQSICIGCGTCAMTCPTRAMTMKNGKPNFNCDRCVKCGLCYYQCTRSWWPIDQIKKEIGLD